MTQPLLAQSIKAIRPDPAIGSSAAVVVDGSPLVHTSQIFAHDESGKLATSTSVAEQANQALSNVAEALESVSSSLTKTVKLNVYVTQDADVAAVRQVLAKRFTSGTAPAVTFVMTALPIPDAKVAMDAVAAFGPKQWIDLDRVLTVTLKRNDSRVSVLPLGTRLYISGQAEKAETLAEATRLTLLGLEKSLQHCGRTKSDIVQVKCFLTPMSKVAEVDQQIEQFFAGGALPVVSHVEWESTLPIEIEVIAFAGPVEKLRPATSVEYLTPPGLSKSPVFSRIARLQHPTTIFIGGLNGKTGEDGTQQVEHIFEQLKQVLDGSGSDLQHLAKATYYVSQDATSEKLNELRPKYYHPDRPPAASKAQVKGVGMAGVGLTVDMIAVPK